MKELRIRDIMQKEVFCATQDMPITAFVAECVRRKITGAPVIDAREELVGILSLSDVAAALAFPRAEDDGLVRTVMTHPVHTVSPNSTLQRAVELFRNHRVHRLIVTYHEHVIGLVSPVDILIRVPAQVL